MATKKFYAAYHAYSTEFSNDVLYILRFETKQKRDAYVNDELWDGDYKREKITRKQAEKIFPDAFRLTDARDLGCCIDARDWTSDTPGAEFFAPYC